MWFLPTQIAQPCDEFQENYTTLVLRYSAMRKNYLVRVPCTRCHFCTSPLTKKIIAKHTFNQAQNVNKTWEITTCVSRDCPPWYWAVKHVSFTSALWGYTLSIILIIKNSLVPISKHEYHSLLCWSIFWSIINYTLWVNLLFHWRILLAGWLTLQ